MSIHIRTFIAGCAFTLAVFAATSFSAPVPKAPPTHGIGTAVTWKASDEAPSDHDRLVALIKRVDRLQVKLAKTSETVNIAADDAANALGLTGCVTGAVQIDERFDGSFVDSREQADGTTPIDSFVVPTLSDDCVGEAG